MSFILDALKKSEAERQRASGPAMFEVKVAPLRARFPTWALLVGALLGINLLVLLWVLLHKSAADSDAGVAATRTPAITASAPSVSGTSALTQPSIVLPLRAAETATASVSVSIAPSGARMQPLPVAPVNPADDRPAVLPGTSEATAALREQALARQAAAAEAARVREQLESTATRVIREPTPTLRAAGLPTRDELVNSGRARIPELQLSLHVFDANPAKRFVFINGQRAHEGDSVASGVVLESITRDGAILSAGGQRFALPVQ